MGHIPGCNDPTTTNVSIVELSSTVTEEDLVRIFSPFGHIDSVKIVWARTAMERTRPTNPGFVSFATRAAAESAIRGLTGTLLEGRRLKLGWGKPARRNAGLSQTRRLTAEAKSFAAAATPSGGQDGLRPHTHAPAAGAAAAAGTAMGAAHGTPPGDVQMTREQAVALHAAATAAALAARPSPLPAGCPAIVLVEAPSDGVTRRLVDLWVPYLARDGVGMESMLLLHRAAQLQVQAESGALAAGAGGLQPALRFDWLVDHSSVAGRYYRWRMWSHLSGGSLSQWSTAPFRISVGGAVWVPPPCPLPGGVTAEEDARLNQRALARAQAANKAATKTAKKDVRAKKPTAPTPGAVAGASAAAVAIGATTAAAVAVGGSCEEQQGGGSESDEAANAADNSSMRKTPGKQSRLRGPKADKSVSQATLEPEDEALWTARLGRLSLERESVGECMFFALEHANAAEQIVSTLLSAPFAAATASLDPSDGAAAEQMPTPLLPAQDIMARLYVVSDILHNVRGGDIKNASRFLPAIQRCLPDAFEGLCASRRAISGRVTTFALRTRIDRLLRAWERQEYFSPMFLSGLECTFLRPHASSAADGGIEESLRTVSVTAADEEELEMRCRHSGLSTAGGPNAMLRRIIALTTFLQGRTKASASNADARPAAMAVIAVVDAAPASSVISAPVAPVDAAPKAEAAPTGEWAVIAGEPEPEATFESLPDDMEDMDGIPFDALVDFDFAFNEDDDPSDTRDENEDAGALVSGMNDEEAHSGLGLGSVVAAADEDEGQAGAGNALSFVKGETVLFSAASTADDTSLAAAAVPVASMDLDAENRRTMWSRGLPPVPVGEPSESSSSSDGAAADSDAEVRPPRKRSRWDPID
jgi:hypothetical protein